MSENYDRVMHLMDTQRSVILPTYYSLHASAVVINGELSILESHSERGYNRDETDVHLMHRWNYPIKGDDDVNASTSEAREILLAHIFHHLVRDWKDKTFYIEFVSAEYGNGFRFDLNDDEHNSIMSVTEKDLIYFTPLEPVGVPEPDEDEEGDEDY